MEAAVEELTPLGVLKQPKVLGAWSEVWTYSRAGVGHSNLTRARDIERRAIPECAMPQFHHQPGSSVSISRAAASIERVTLGGTERNVLSNLLSSSGEPLEAVSTRCRSFLRSTFFSRRAAGEMIRRVERIVANVMRERAAAMTDAIVWAGTFHAVGARLLRESQHESLSAPIPRLVLNHKHVVSNASRERAKGNLCHAGRPSHGYQPTRLRPGASGSGTVIVDRPQSSSACRSTAGGS
jgi:hypothetical protein